MARAKRNNGYILPDDKLQQRELAFVVYRDLGPTRSMRKLAEVMAKGTFTRACQSCRRAQRARLGAEAAFTRAGFASPK